jgi:hypothetical protein
MRSGLMNQRKDSFAAGNQRSLSPRRRLAYNVWGRATEARSRGCGDASGRTYTSNGIGNRQDDWHWCLVLAQDNWYKKYEGTEMQSSPISKRLLATAARIRNLVRFVAEAVTSICQQVKSSSKMIISSFQRYSGT